MRYDAEYWIQHLQLTPHPEGGAFAETYRYPLTLPRAVLPADFAGDRHAATQIYFLLRKGEYSSFHRILSDEIWHFYAGDTLLVHEIRQDGAKLTHTLGADPAEGAQFTSVIRAKSWYAAELAGDGDYALVGGTCAPGFDYADFVLAKRGELTRRFPQHAELIARLTRDP